MKGPFDGAGKRGGNPSASKRILERAARDTDTIGASALARTANRIRRHFLGTEDGAEDPVELWGKRIGRALGVIGFVVVAFWLIVTLGKLR